MADSTSAQQQYPNLNPYASTNGNGSVSSAKSTLVNSKVSCSNGKEEDAWVAAGICEEQLATIASSCDHAAEPLPYPTTSLKRTPISRLIPNNR
jgi:hypothetical protein